MSDDRQAWLFGPPPPEPPPPPGWWAVEVPELDALPEHLAPLLDAWLAASARTIRMAEGLEAVPEGLVPPEDAADWIGVSDAIVEGTRDLLRGGCAPGEIPALTAELRELLDRQDTARADLLAKLPPEVRDAVLTRAEATAVTPTQARHEILVAVVLEPGTVEPPEPGPADLPEE